MRNITRCSAQAFRRQEENSAARVRAGTFESNIPGKDATGTEGTVSTQRRSWSPELWYPVKGVDSTGYLPAVIDVHAAGYG